MLLPVASHITGKTCVFLVIKATVRQHVNPENLVLALTRLWDFLFESEVTSLYLPLNESNRYSTPKRDKWSSKCDFLEIYNEMYLHKKIFLSVC